MGQKVHPKGFRIGIIRDWDSNWYADRDYVDLVHEDFKILPLLRIGVMVGEGTVRLLEERDDLAADGLQEGTY